MRFVFFVAKRTWGYFNAEAAAYVQTHQQMSVLKLLHCSSFIERAVHKLIIVAILASPSAYMYLQAKFTGVVFVCMSVTKSDRWVGSGAIADTDAIKNRSSYE